MVPCASHSFFLYLCNLFLSHMSLYLPGITVHWSIFSRHLGDVMEETLYLSHLVSMSKLEYVLI